MSIFTTRKSSNEYGFFVAVTSLSKIDEGWIRGLTGDVLFPVAFKASISTVTMKNPGHYWCVMSNKALTGTINRAKSSSPMDRSFDFPSTRQSNKQGWSKYSPMNQARPRTGALTSRVLTNRTSRVGQIFSQEPGKDAGD